MQIEHNSSEPQSELQAAWLDFRAAWRRLWHGPPKVNMAGNLATVVDRAQPAPLRWRLANSLRWSYLTGRLYNRAAKLFSKVTGIPTMTATLSIVKRAADGSRVNYGVVGYRVVTTAFVNFMVDQLQAETSVWGDFKFHDSGIGSTAEAIGDTDIETTDGESRVTGTQTEGASANIYASVGTIAYTSTLALREHGLFSIVTAGTLMDRTVFAAINVVNGDSVQYTYELTVSSGG